MDPTRPARTLTQNPQLHQEAAWRVSKSPQLLIAGDGAIQRSDLLRVHLLANLQQDMELRLLQIGSRLGDTVDRGKHLRFILQVFMRHGDKPVLLTLQIPAERKKIVSIRFESAAAGPAADSAS